MTEEQRYQLFLLLVFGVGPVLLSLFSVLFSLLVLIGAIK